MSHVLLLIGEMGAGKNYWGEKISGQLDIPFFDGDDVVTPEMLERVKKFKPLSKELIDDYVYNHLGPTIFNRAAVGNLIAAQALYRSEHRAWIIRQLEELGHTVAVVHVNTPFLQNMEQLWSRPNGYKWILFWLLNKPFFQKLSIPHDTIYKG